MRCTDTEVRGPRSESSTTRAITAATDWSPPKSARLLTAAARGPWALGLGRSIHQEVNELPRAAYQVPSNCGSGVGCCGFDCASDCHRSDMSPSAFGIRSSTYQNVLVKEREDFFESLELATRRR